MMGGKRAPYGTAHPEQRERVVVAQQALHEEHAKIGRVGHGGLRVAAPGAGLTGAHVSLGAHGAELGDLVLLVQHGELAGLRGSAPA